MEIQASAIGSTATKHGRDLLGMGFTVSQVVHDYGDICQAITELAVEKKAPISTEEFHTLNRCLDTAIAEAVTEYARLKEETTSLHEVERLGQLAHELRNQIQTALLSFEVLKAGTVGVGGSTGALLGRSIIGLRELIDSTLSEVRLSAPKQLRERVSLLVFVDEVAVAANLYAEYRDIQLTVEAVDPSLAINVDPQLLASALMNLLHNAFKFTHAKGNVTLRTRAENGRVFIEVEDECGGARHTDVFRPFGDRRGNDRSGLGLGLSISRKAVKASSGEIHTRNVDGKGCIFTIELPLTPLPA
ncbi:MAG TPA: HAMP domain-containing sensor histidine kinase [Thermoleophilia bacterium]|nr:HAMP domain-containing sensor histidine kinase [Thermoleophilia bacterium]